MGNWQPAETAPTDGTPFCMRVVVKQVNDKAGKPRLMVVEFPTDGTARWCPVD